MPGMDFFGWEGPASYESAIIIQIFKKLLYFYGLAWKEMGPISDLPACILTFPNIVQRIYRIRLLIQTATKTCDRLYTGKLLNV